MLDKYIKTLIAKLGFVSVPGLGSFVKALESTNDDAINKPKYAINFTESTTTEKEMHLVKEISEGEMIDEEDALYFIKQHVDEIKANLKEKGEYKFYSIGVLQKNEPDQIIFFPSENLLDDEMFGLPESVHAEPIANEEDEEIEIEKRKRHKKEELHKKKKKQSDNNLVVGIVMLLLIFGGGGGYYFYKKNKSVPKVAVHQEVTEHHDENAEEESHDDKWGADEETNTNTETTSHQESATSKPESDKKIVKKEANVQPTATYSSEPTISGKTNRYYVIVGGFAIRDNAVRFNAELNRKGYNSKIIDPEGNNNLYKVSLDDYSTFNEAYSKVNDTRDEFNEPWVMKH